MQTIKGIYNNGEVKLLEAVNFERPQKVLITFLEETFSEEEEIRQISFMQPNGFLEEYLSDKREDLYQEYAEKIRR